MNDWENFLKQTQSSNSSWTPRAPTAQPISTSIAGFSPYNPGYTGVNFGPGTTGSAPTGPQYAPGSISNDSRIAGGHMSAPGVGPNTTPEKTSWGGKLGMVGDVAQSLAGLFSVIQGFKQTKLMAKNFNFQKDAWTKQYNMSKEDHDRELADRAKNRKQVEDQTLSA